MLERPQNNLIWLLKAAPKINLRICWHLAVCLSLQNWNEASFCRLAAFLRDLFWSLILIKKEIMWSSSPILLNIEAFYSISYIRWKAMHFLKDIGTFSLILTFSWKKTMRKEWMKKLINFDVGSRRAILDQIDVSTKRYIKYWSSI